MELIDHRNGIEYRKPEGSVDVVGEGRQVGAFADNGANLRMFLVKGDGGYSSNL